MSEIDRFVAGDHARTLRNIAILIQPTMAHFADHLRAIADQLDEAAGELVALSQPPDEELE